MRFKIRAILPGFVLSITILNEAVPIASGVQGQMLWMKVKLLRESLKNNKGAPVAPLLSSVCQLICLKLSIDRYFYFVATRG